MLRWWLLLALLVLTPAIARAEQKTVAVHVEGPQAASYRERVLAAMPRERIDVASEGDFGATMKQAGLRGPLGAAISSKSSRAMLLKALRKAMGTAHVDAVILGRVTLKPKARELHLLWVSLDGDPPIDEPLEMSGVADEEVAAIVALLGPELEALAPPPPPEPEPAPPPAPPSDGDEDDDERDDDQDGFRKNRPGYELFAAELGVQFNGRFFSYSDSPANTANARPYDVFGVPAIRVAAEIYPAAPFDVPVARDLGITGRFFYAFGLESQTADARYLYDTSWYALRVGLRYRLRLGDEERPFVFGIAGSYGRMAFEFEEVMAQGPSILEEIATVQYQTLRGGLDARLPLHEHFVVAAAGGFSGALDGGDVYDRYRDAFLAGFDVELSLIAPLAAGIETRVGAEYERYFSSFEPVPGDVYVAGGALDQLIALRLGVAYVF